MRVERDIVSNYIKTTSIPWMYGHPTYSELWRTVFEMWTNMIQKQILTICIPKPLRLPSFWCNNHFLNIDDGTDSVLGTRKIKQDAIFVLYLLAVTLVMLRAADFQPGAQHGPHRKARGVMHFGIPPSKWDVFCQRVYI